MRPVVRQRGSNGQVSNHSKVVRAATFGLGVTANEPGQGASTESRLQNVLKDTPRSHPAPIGENQVLCVGHKRPLFQPPPPDNKTFEDEEDEGGSDDWSIIDGDSDSDDASPVSEEHVRECQKSKAAPTYIAGKLHDSHPRVHPLCTAKYGDFFKL